jgi:hypothetical protein
MCNRCGRPVYLPEHRRPGFEGCQCVQPDLETWEQQDAELRAYFEEKEKQTIDAIAAITPGTPLHIVRGGFWKKQAKNR